MFHSYPINLVDVQLPYFLLSNQHQNEFPSSLRIGTIVFREGPPDTTHT